MKEINVRKKTVIHCGYCDAFICYEKDLNRNYADTEIKCPNCKKIVIQLDYFFITRWEYTYD